MLFKQKDKIKEGKIGRRNANARLKSSTGSLANFRENESEEHTNLEVDDQLKQYF